MHPTTMRLLTQCETNDHLIALVEHFDLIFHKAERAGNRMKLYFEPTFDGDNIDCVSLPLELFKSESYMPSWLKLIGGK